MAEEPKPTDAVTEAEKTLKAKAEEDAKIQREEEALTAIDINIPVAPWLADQNAALQIRNYRLQLDHEVDVAMRTARKRHNGPQLQALGAQKAEIEERMRILLLAHPGARNILETWAKQEEPD